MRRAHAGTIAIVFLGLVAGQPAGAEAPPCAPGVPVEVAGEVSSGDARSYLEIPFDVQGGTTRIEVGYSWSDSASVPSTPLTQTVFDLGLWDEGYPAAASFRGWSGSRHGKLHDGQSPVFVQADAATRGYVPGTIQPGIWIVDLGIAAVGPGGASWTVRVECLDPPMGAEPVSTPVDPGHVAHSIPGWYHGDFHMHGLHSSPSAPDWPGFVGQARAAGLDFLMVTEYVTGRHWDELGPIQDANADLLVFPGREIITYYGHAITHGETPGVLEYRHGFGEVTLGGIQADAKDAGALFQVAHPTIFPGPVFQSFCRGCEFTLGDDIDWDLVDLIEVHTGPILVNSTDAGLPAIPGRMQNPFTQPAIDLWEDLLRHGHRIAGVSGSDSKGNEPNAAERERRGYGSSATAVYAEELSREGLRAALAAGHAYVKTRGAFGSPIVELGVTTADGQQGIYGDTVYADLATLHVTVVGGEGQLLRFVANGELAGVVPVLTDPFEQEWPAVRLPNEGPLGTFWRIETLDAESLTTIGNPVFLRAPGLRPASSG